MSFRHAPFDPTHALLICESAFDNAEAIAKAMDLANGRRRITGLRHCGKDGAQRLAGRWSLNFVGLKQAIHSTWAEAVEAGGAGCIAFPGSSADDVEAAVAAGIPVWRPYG